MSTKDLLVATLVTLFVFTAANPAENRSPKRIHLPFLGLGPKCTGCPQDYCDDDAAIIHGYCCGCAKFYDNLPVVCSREVNCPYNSNNLCEDYEYMMHCCC